MILKGLSLTVWKEQISFTIISIDMDKMSTRLNWKIKHSKVNLLSPVIKIKNYFLIGKAAADVERYLAIYLWILAKRLYCVR